MLQTVLLSFDLHELKVHLHNYGLLGASYAGRPLCFATVYFYSFDTIMGAQTDKKLLTLRDTRTKNERPMFN